MIFFQSSHWSNTKPGSPMIIHQQVIPIFTFDFLNVLVSFLFGGNLLPKYSWSLHKHSF